MKILCLNPPFKTTYGRFSRTSRSPAITKSGTIYYPIWLAYVTGVLEKAGFSVTLMDSCAYSLNLQKTIELIKEVSPRLVILETSTPSILSDIQTADEIKKILPGAFVVLMGTHPTALPQETLSMSSCVDGLIVGEADYTAKDLALRLQAADLQKFAQNSSYRNLILAQINGLVFRTESGIHTNPKRPLIENLDELPFVSEVYQKHLDPKKYFFAASDYPEIQIMTARGCIARCSFCVYPQTIHQGKYRMRSPENIAREFCWIKENMPQIREIGIEDDTFAGSSERVIAFCKELIKHKIMIKWYCNVRADLSIEVMRWMKKAKCVLMTVGYESANARILENINKRISPQTIIDFSHNAKKAGLLVHGCFMAGNRGETPQTLDESLALSLKLMDDTMQFFPLMVYPGTADYEWAKKEGLLTVHTYEEYVTADGNHNSVLRMPNMSSEEIREWCDYARRHYYLRPRYLLYKLFQQITRPSEIRRTVKAAKRFIRFLRPSGVKKCI